MKIKLLINIFILIALNSKSFAASFDCAKAVSRIENEICASPELSDLDYQLANAYKSAISRSDDIDGVKAAQRAWLKETRNSCGDVNCLISVYKDRIEALAGNQKNSQATQEKTDAYYQKDFNSINNKLAEINTKNIVSVDQDISKTEITEEDLINEEGAASADWERKQAQEAEELAQKKAAEAEAQLAKKKAEEAAAAEEFEKNKAEESAAIEKEKNKQMMPPSNSLLSSG